MHQYFIYSFFLPLGCVYVDIHYFREELSKSKHKSNELLVCSLSNNNYNKRDAKTTSTKKEKVLIGQKKRSDNNIHIQTP